MLLKRITRLLSLFCILALSVQVHAGDGSCVEVSRTCVDGPSTKIISGEPITRDCWKYEGKYQCAGNTLVEDGCQALRDKGCGQVAANCVESDANGRCILYDKKFQCKISDGVTQNILDCGGQQFCTDGLCFDTKNPPDGDFATAVTGMEVMREAGNYMDPASMRLFTGKSSQCSVKLGGLFSCCKPNTKGGSKTNANMLTQLGVSAAMSIGSETVKALGSGFNYDSLFTGDGLGGVLSGVGDMLSGADFSNFSPSVGYLGVSIGTGLLPIEAGVYAMPITDSVFISFDPTSFAISVALMVITEMLSCDQEEQILALKRGANLCVNVGTYCSRKFLGICLTKKESYCCYNSKLAKIINISGRAQLGLGFGNVRNPDCSGFTVEQVQGLDFSRMDFSEAFAEIQANIKTPDQAANRATLNINSYFTP